VNKYVIRTSVFWIALIAAGAIAYFFYLRGASPPLRHDMTVQPIAAGESKNRAESSSNTTSPAFTAGPLQLSPKQMQSIGVETAIVQRQPITDDIRATGTVGINERLVSYVQLRFTGYLRRVFANAPLQFIKKGDPLFTIYSPELVAAENEYLVALRNQKRLQSSAIDAVAAGASELVSSAEARLRQWDVPQSVLNQVRETGSPDTEMLVTSPVSGYITERNALPNLYVEPATRLYAISDLSRVWIDAQVFPEDIARLKPGDVASISIDASGRPVRGRIESILPQVDTATRTGRVRIDLSNPGMRFRPGMYVNVQLKSSLGPQITVPASAVLMSGTRSIAFLYRGNGQLIPQDVEAGQRVGDRLIILKGLSPGQRVVSSATFLVDSESQLQAAAGAFAPSPPGAGSTSQATAPQFNIDFATAPSPPQRGQNRFRVHLTDPEGKPVRDANVTVVFYMAAMPAMGMAAMTTKSDLRPSAPGIYEGSGKLDSGGTWQVTITIRRGGAVIANKQVNVTATGGM
jgi:Cu(I)/Ag(I) efflux system membrane fusion protein/cobalt-zinc-cadmium efflux system membrane fusion protein